jgi:hypothetical protein
MSKKIKLNLEDLKVESFVTSLNNKQKNMIKGGSNFCTWTCGTNCGSNCLCATFDCASDNGCGGGGGGTSGIQRCVCEPF